jgi:prepilin-type N-terminal cleavage/methylation domain-containing protein
MKQDSNRGFSLIESLIVISIIAIMSTLAMQALPVARSSQQLTSDTEQIRALLLDAKERTLNQVRPANCLPSIAIDDPAKAPCSDVGVAFIGKQIIEFADTFPTTPDHRYLVGDYIIGTYNLSAKVGAGSVTSLLFQSAPPSISLFEDTFLMSPSFKAKIILNGYPPLTRTLLVHSYGTIDVL